MQKLLKLRDNLLKFFVAATVLAVPLYPKFPFIDIPGTYVSVRLEDFILLGLSVLLATYIFPNLKEHLKDTTVRAILLFLTIGALSLVSGLVLTKTVSPLLGFLHWARRIEYFVPFFAGLIILSKHKSALSFVIKLLMLTTLIIFIYGYGQKHFAWPVVVTQNEEYSKGIALQWIPGSHINSTFAGHYDLATYLVLVLPIFVALLFVVKDVKIKALLFGLTLCGLWLLSNAISRISIVSYLVSSSLALLFLKKYKGVLVMFLISFLFFSFSSDLIARYMSIFDVIKTRVKIGTTFNAHAKEEVLPIRVNTESPTPTPQPVLEDRSSSIRFNVEWPRAIRAFTKNPLLGTGFSSITLATDNEFLRLLGEVGLLGLAAFLLIFARLAIEIGKAVPVALGHFSPLKRAFLAGFSAGSFGVFMNSVFIDVFEASKFAIMFWLFAGLAVFLVRSYKNEQNN